VKVVGNQGPSITGCLGLTQNSSQAVEEIVAVSIVEKDLLPRDSTTDDMMQCGWVISRFFLCQDGSQRCDEVREVQLNDVPKDVEIHFIVCMNEPIAETSDFLPGYFGMSSASAFGYAGCFFPYDLQQTHQGQVQLPVSITRSTLARPEAICRASEA